MFNKLEERADIASSVPPRTVPTRLYPPHKRSSAGTRTSSTTPSVVAATRVPKSVANCGYGPSGAALRDPVDRVAGSAVVECVYANGFSAIYTVWE